jgi:hypothetical protein
MNDNALQNRATEIVRPLVPPDPEQRVNRSFKQWNQVVRDHIRNKTGLKLSDGDSRFAIPVRVVRGFPITLAQLIDQYRDPVMWWLIIGHLILPRSTSHGTLKPVSFEYGLANDDIG